MTESSTSVAGTHGRRIPFGAVALLWSLAALVFIVMAGAVTSALAVALAPGSFGPLDLQSLFDGDLWWLVGLTFLLTAVIVAAGGFLVQVFVHRKRPVPLAQLLRPLFFVVLAVATGAAALVMAVAVLALTRLMLGA